MKCALRGRFAVIAVIVVSGCHDAPTDRDDPALQRRDAGAVDAVVFDAHARRVPYDVDFAAATPPWPEPEPRCDVGYRGVAVGGAAASAVCDDGRVVSWGTLDELGYIQRDGDPEPRIVRGLADAVEVGVGTRAECARTAPGDVWCWGSNEDAMLGHLPAREEEVSKEPIRIELPARATQLVVGSGHACALLDDQRIACWGSGGNGAAGPRRRCDPCTPSVVPGVQARRLVTGGRVTCAIDRRRRVWCWGNNERGTLAVGHRRRHRSLARIGSFNDVIDIATNGRESCLVRRGGQIWCWGDQVRDGNFIDTDPVVPPRRRFHLPGVLHVYPQRYTYLAMTAERTVGVIDPATGTVREIEGLGPVRDLASDMDAACAVTEAGALRCWGNNVGGHLILRLAPPADAGTP